MARADHLDPDNSHWHWLAVDLRVWRLERNLSQADVAELLGVDNSTVSNYESGSAKLPKGHADTLDVAWSTHGHFGRLRRLAESDHDPNWFDEFTKHERRSTSVRPYNALAVPALLQTPEYARSLLSVAQTVDDVDGALSDRMKRQEVLTRPHPPRLWALIKQSALEDPIGGAEIMRAQLGHLVHMSNQENVIVRVVPREAGAHSGIDGSFTLLSTPRGDLAWADAVGGGRLMTDPAKVAMYEVRWGMIGADALSRDSSRGLITRIMEAMK